MSKPPSSRMAELLAAAEKRKHDALRTKLGIAPTLAISTFQLESLGYHLIERSGPAHVRREGDSVRVSEKKGEEGIAYTGDAASILLKAWGLSDADVRDGIEITVKDGKRV